MFHLFNKPNKNNIGPNPKDKQKIEISEESSEFFKLLENSDFKNAKEYLNNNPNIDKDKIVGLYLENLLKNPENKDFSNLYDLIESNIINIDEVKHNQFISLILTQAINKFQKENNLNAISRLENLELI